MILIAIFAIFCMASCFKDIGTLGGRVANSEQLGRRIKGFKGAMGGPQLGQHCIFSSIIVDPLDEFKHFLTE